MQDVGCEPSHSRRARQRVLMLSDAIDRGDCEIEDLVGEETILLVLRDPRLRRDRLLNPMNRMAFRSPRLRISPRFVQGQAVGMFLVRRRDAYQA